MNNNVNQLVLGISYSYIRYIDEYLSLLNNSLYSSVLYLDEETWQMLEDLKNHFLSLPDILSKDLTAKEEYASQILHYRITLEKKYRTLTAYQRELHHLTTRFNFLADKVDISPESLQMMEDEMHAIDFDLMAKDCASFVFDSKNPGSRQERASLLLPYIPIRITKENYIDYLRKSIEHIAIQDTPDALNMLLDVLWQLFDGHLCPDYGVHFKDLAITLDDLSLLKTDEDFYENAELLGETIDTLLRMLNNIYKLTGALANLLIFDQLNFQEITNMHISFNDLYYSLKNILSAGENTDLFLTALPDRVKEIEDQIQNDYEKVLRTHQTDSLFLLMHSYLSIDISHIFGFDIQKSKPFSSEAALMINTFLDELKKKLLALSSSDRKLRMQYFISTIPFVMSSSVFETYIRQSFSNAKAPWKSLVAANYLIQLMEENTSSETPVSSDHKASHHQCGCKDHHHHH